MVIGQPVQEGPDEAQTAIGEDIPVESSQLQTRRVNQTLTSQTHYLHNSHTQSRTIPLRKRKYTTAGWFAFHAFQLAFPR